jgi:hypothetical protein
MNEKTIKTLEGLITWLYNIRDKDENLVIETAPEGISLSDSMDLLETLKENN